MRRKTYALALSLPLLFGGATCVSAADALALDAPLPKAVPSGTSLVVADQHEILKTLFRGSGVEKGAPEALKFANFSDGPEILEAFRAGAVDVGLVGDAPPIQAQAQGENVLIIGALKNGDHDYQLAVAPGEKIESLADLRGKRFAYAAGTGREAFTLRVLQLAGLGRADVKIANLAPGDFAAALRSNQVDVATMREPDTSFYLQANKAKGATIVPAAKLPGASTGLMYLYVRTAALQDPAKAAALRDFVGRWVKGWVWANGHRDVWVDSYYVKGQGLSKLAGETVYDVNGPTTFPRIDQSLFDIQQQTADLLLSAGSIRRKVNAREEFDARFDPVVQEAANATGG